MIEKVNAVPIILPSTESMTVEFKSDRNGYPDHELIEALTCLANSQGGELWLGVEDNGSASGLHPRHQDTLQLTQLIADNTSPALQVTIKQHQINGVTVAQILVPEAKRLVATRTVLIYGVALNTMTPQNAFIFPRTMSRNPVNRLFKAVQ